MDTIQLILGLLQPIIGKGKATAGDNYAFHCPFCNHKKPKLEVNLLTNEKKQNYWHCWACDKKGKSLVTLLKALNSPLEKINEVKSLLSIPITEKQGKIGPTVVTLPKEFISLSTIHQTLSEKQARKYLKVRGIGEEDILKYNIGYCEKGKYANRIIVPSYDENGILNYFIARSFEKEPFRAYDAPSCDKNALIGLEFFINWNVPIILCEGVFDAIAIKRNAIPLFGKTISKALMTRLVQTNVKTIYLALDSDKWGQKNTLQYIQQLMNLGKEVYSIDLQEKDPSELGFKNILPLLHSATPLTFADIVIRKLKLI